MYLLKIEEEKGYYYTTLPKSFDIVTESEIGQIQDIKIESGIKGVLYYPIVIDKNGKEYKHDEYVTFHKASDLCSPPAVKTNARVVFKTPYKYIKYYDEKVCALRHIFFNGRAYLIKENGKTIEKF